MGLLDELTAGAQAGWEVEVRSNVAPPLRFGLDAKEPSALTRFVKPNVTIRKSGRVIYSSAPAGEPFPYAWVVAAVLGALASAFVISRVLK